MINCYVRSTLRGQKPNRSPAKRVRFGKEEQGSGRMTFFVSIEIKNVEAKRTLLRRGAADGTRTRTPRGHKHLKLASLPIPAQPHPDGPRKNRLIIILSRRGFVNYYLDRPRRKIGSFLRCPGFYCFGLLGDGLFLLQQLLVQLDGVPLTVAVGQHRFQGDGGQLG